MRIVWRAREGILTERADITLGEASELLRTYARRRNRKLTDVADAVVRDDLAVTDLVVRAGAPATD